MNEANGNRTPLPERRTELESVLSKPMKADAQDSAAPFPAGPVIRFFREKP